MSIIFTIFFILLGIIVASCAVFLIAFELNKDKIADIAGLVSVYAMVLEFAFSFCSIICLFAKEIR